MTRKLQCNIKHQQSECVGSRYLMSQSAVAVLGEGWEGEDAGEMTSAHVAHDRRVAANKADGSWGCIDSSIDSRLCEGRNTTDFLLSTSYTTFRIVCPLLGSPVQEIHR